MEMEISIKRDLNETYLVLPEGTINEAAYRIMSDHPQAHLMKPEIHPEKGCAFIVNGGNTLEYRYRKEAMTISAVRKLFFDLDLAFTESRNCLLMPENILLRPQLILERETGTFVFLAHPGMTEDLFAGLRRLVYFCCENFAGKVDEQAVMDRLKEKAEEEIFGFEELLRVLSESSVKKQETLSDAASEDPGKKKHPLLLPAVFLLLAFLLYMLFFTKIGDGEPRLLLGSFVCLAASAGSLIPWLTNSMIRR